MGLRHDHEDIKDRVVVGNLDIRVREPILLLNVVIEKHGERDVLGCDLEEPADKQDDPRQEPHKWGKYFPSRKWRKHEDQELGHHRAFKRMGITFLWRLGVAGEPRRRRRRRELEGGRMWSARSRASSPEWQVV